MNTDTNDITISRDARFVELHEKKTPALGGPQSVGDEFFEVKSISSRPKKCVDEENPKQPRDQEESEEDTFFEWDDEQERQEKSISAALEAYCQNGW